MAILKEQIALRQTAPDTYTASFHKEWSVGAVVYGGACVAIIHHALETHLQSQSSLKQPDILNMHLEFLRSCEQREFSVVITAVKLGAVASTFQVRLCQNGSLKVLALCVSTDFDRSLGPTVQTAWTLLPPPLPKPDLERVLAHKPDANWIPIVGGGEIIPITSRLLILDPRNGFPVDGLCDAWNGFPGDERIDSTWLAMMSDLIPSMSDTLLRNNGTFDAHAFQARGRKWADENPGIPAHNLNSLAEASKATVWNQTMTLDVEFKRRLPPGGLQFVFLRTSTRMLDHGRMDVEATICDENMDLLCTARQLILVLEAGRKFQPGKKKKNESSL